MQIGSPWDNLHDMPNPALRGKQVKHAQISSSAIPFRVRSISTYHTVDRLNRHQTDYTLSTPQRKNRTWKLRQTLHPPFPSPTPYEILIKWSGKFLTLRNHLKTNIIQAKKGKRKVQGEPQSQTAAFPRPQEEEETDKSKQAQTEQTYEKH